MDNSTGNQRCKAGDLAIVINAPEKISSNIGKVVRVLRLASPDEYCDEYTGVVWMVESAGGPLLSFTWPNDSSPVIKILVRTMRDVNLFPIKSSETKAKKERKRDKAPA